MDEARITRPSPLHQGDSRQRGLLQAGSSPPAVRPSPYPRRLHRGAREEVLEMVRWALSHEDDEGFDTAEVLTSWAKKRGRGAWSGRPRRPERNSDGELTWALANFWAEHPRELAELLERVQARVNANGRS